MRQGFVRALALGALTVVVCAPVATAGATGGGSATGSAATVAAPHRAPTWGDVVGRLRQLGRLDPPSPASGGAAASLRAAAAPAVGVAALPTVPAITATPTTGLKSGDPIAVSGTGFAAGSYAVAECAAGATSPGDCDLGGVTVLQSDSSGAFATTMAARRTLRLSTARLDCATAAGTCEIVTIDVQTFVATAARASLSFDPTAALPHPSLVVTPSSNLRDGQQVTVAGTGWKPNSFISVGQCFTGSVLCIQGSDSSSSIGADGKFSLGVTVSLRGNDDFGQLTNCLAASCEIDAQSYDAPDYYAAASITFDPSQPIPPPPTLTVVPSTGLHHNQTVSLSGAGFDPNSEVWISECPPSTFGFCDDGILGVQTDASGAFANVGIAVSRLVTAYPTDGSSTPTPVDCAPSGCSISGSSSGGRLSLVASAPLAFDASVPPPPLPVVTVTPHADLPYRATVTVHGTGYAPGEFVSASYCVDADLGFFCSGSYAYGTADGQGVVDLPISVRRRFTFDTHRLDCVDPATTCAVDVTGAHGYERASVPLTFDPNAPIPPQPTATVTPDHDLGYRQTATVTGDGFAPGTVGVEECGTFDTGVTDVCPVFAQLTADASGHVSGTVDILRILSFGPGGGPQVDCATASQPCVLQVGNFDDDIITIPLQFDPNSQPPPAPALTVTPSTGLFDGQHVTVAGRNFLPGSQVGVTECRAGVTAIADGCDLSQVRVATVGADGTFSRRYVTESVLRTSDGPIDCTVRPDACVLTAANAPARTDFAAAPVSFAPPELAVFGVGVTEGTGDMTMAPVHVMLSKPDRNPITVHWVADAETAAPGTDYTSMRGSLTIPAGATDAMIDADVVADAVDEPTETFRIRVTDALGTDIVDSTGVVTIHDDDPAPRVSVSDARRREDHGEVQAEVRLSAPSGRTVVVHYVTHHGSADAGSDYVRKDSRLVFLPGETRHLVRVTLVNDRVHEPTETFQVEIDRVEQATIARGTATATITDDD